MPFNAPAASGHRSPPCRKILPKVENGRVADRWSCARPAHGCSASPTAPLQPLYSQERSREAIDVANGGTGCAGQQLVLRALDLGASARQIGRTIKSDRDTRVPIPKFASFRRSFVCELWNRRTLAGYRSSVALVLKSAFWIRRTNDADFRTATLGLPACSPACSWRGVTCGRDSTRWKILRLRRQ